MTAIAYLLGSVFVLRSNNAGVAMLGIIMGFYVLLMVAVALNLQGLFDLVEGIINGPFGLRTAMTGKAVNVANFDLWLGASLLWLGIGVLGVWLAARKYKER